MENISPSKESDWIFKKNKKSPARLLERGTIMSATPHSDEDAKTFPLVFIWFQQLRFPPVGLTLSLSFSFSLSMDLFSPSSSRSISLTVSPERVLNFFLDKFGREQRSRRRLGAPDGTFAAGISCRYNYCYIKPSCRRLQAIHFVQSGKSDEHNKQNMSQTFNNPLSPPAPPQLCLLAAITASLWGCVKPSLSGWAIIKSAW